MPEDIGASTGRHDEPASPMEGGESNATPTTLSEASPVPGVPLRTLDVGVFEDAPPEYAPATAADTENSLAASRRARRGAAGRPRGWMAYTVFLMVVLLALLIRFAVLSAAPVTAQTASETTATADLTATATPSPGITPNATVPVVQGGHTTPTPGPEEPFTVTSAWISVSPTSMEGYCDEPGPTTEEFQGFVYVPGTTPGGTITYRWRLSDGTVTPTQSVLIGPTDRPSYYDAAGGQLIRGQWAIGPAGADGSRKWAEFEILTPSHLLSSPGYFWMKCEFMVYATSPSVSGGTGGPNPRYDCVAGGDQTFTFTGTISAHPGPLSHTVTYHWLRSDGTQGPDQSVTFSPGQSSASVQPDIVVMTHDQAMAKPGQLWEKIVVTTNPDAVTYAADYYAWCSA